MRSLWPRDARGLALRVAVRFRARVFAAGRRFGDFVFVRLRFALAMGTARSTIRGRRTSPAEVGMLEGIQQFFENTLGGATSAAFRDPTALFIGLVVGLIVGFLAGQSSGKRLST